MKVQRTRRGSLALIRGSKAGIVVTHPTFRRRSGQPGDRVPIWTATLADSDRCLTAGALTHRQPEVLQLLAEGYAMREVGGLLNLTPRTVAAITHHIV
jgi:DNA-binding NarL/FixJ family response regulator